MAKRKRNKALRRAIAIVGLVLCVIFSFTLICNLTIIIKGTLWPDVPPSVLGMTPMVTLSSSMDGEEKDSFSAGDLIFVGKAKPEELKVGDIIAFKDGSIIVSHRIVSVQTAEDGSIQWITKGDANNVEDSSPVTAGQLVGKYRAHIPGLGNFALFLQKPLGMILFIGVPMLAFIIYDILRRQHYAKKEKNKEAKMQAEIERLRALAGEDKD